LLDRGPPKDTDAEKAVLAVVLLAPGRMTDVAALIDPGDFADEALRTVFCAMLRLHRRGVPPCATLVVGELSDAGEYDADRGVSAGAMIGYFRLYPLATSLLYYVARVAEMSRRRRALERGIALIQAANAIDAGPPVSPAIRRATQHALEHRGRRTRKAARR
jgi:replicative DNA helicase